MAANPPPSSAPANDDVTRGLPLYASTRAHLKDLLAKKARVEEQLRKKEEEILQKETEYLLQTPAGNIITGFDSYVKNVGSSGGMTASRRKVEITDSMRVFSGSSVSFVKMDVGSRFFFFCFFFPFSFFLGGFGITHAKDSVDSGSRGSCTIEVKLSRNGWCARERTKLTRPGHNRRHSILDAHGHRSSDAYLHHFPQGRDRIQCRYAHECHGRT